MKKKAENSNNSENPSLNIAGVINRCKNCNEPIIYDDFIKMWRHDRDMCFFDNAHFCDNHTREPELYAQLNTDL